MARRYVSIHPDTLLVVTGDHECGGLAVEDTGGDDESGGDAGAQSVEDGPFPIKGSDRRFVMDWTTGEHTDAPVPVTAVGPGAERFVGEHANTYVFEVLSGSLAAGP